MFAPRQERWVEELNVHRHYEQSITSSGAIMTLPDATADLRDWLCDRRKFMPKQYDDWMQVIRDFNASVKQTGPRLARVVESVTKQIDSRLPGLFVPGNPNPVASPIATFLHRFMPDNAVNRIVAIDRALQWLTTGVAVKENRTYKIDPVVREDIRQHVEQLHTKLSSEEAIIGAWRDLLSSAKNLARRVEEVAFRRDTLYAIAQRRNLDGIGSFGVFGELSSLVSDVANAVHEEIQRESGVEPEPYSFPPGTSTSVQR